MSDAHEANRDQFELWNQGSGNAWVDMQGLLDEMLGPFEKLLMEQALDDGTKRLLDVGCGSGSTTLSAARRMSVARR